MPRFFLATIAAIGLFGASAFAADMPTKAPPANIAPPPYNWSGFYVGANFGGGWTSGNLNIPGNNFYGGISELIGGVQAGYNVQAGSLLFGVEGDFDWASFDHPLLPAPTLGSASQHWISTVAGRVGIVKDRWLVFGKLGGGWVHSTALLNLPGGSWNGSNTDAGVLIGGGLEYGFKAHWTLKLEYDYLTQSTWMSTTALPVSLSRVRPRRERRVCRDHAEALLVGKDLLTQFVPTHVELANWVQRGLTPLPGSSAFSSRQWVLLVAPFG